MDSASSCRSSASSYWNRASSYWNRASSCDTSASSLIGRIGTCPIWTLESGGDTAEFLPDLWYGQPHPCAFIGNPSKPAPPGLNGFAQIEDTRDFLIPRFRMLDRRRKQSGEVKIRRERSGVLDFNPVIVNGEVDCLPAVLVAAMGEGVHQCFAERVRRNLQLLVPLDLAARPCRQIQMLEAECHRGVHQLEDIALHMGIVEEHPLVRSLEPAHLDFELRVVDALRLPEENGGTIQQGSVLP